jgi:hypothetical protein
VTFARPTLITPHNAYEVVRVFPADGLERNYGIKCAGEPFERVVKERDLAPFDETRPAPALQELRRETMAR